MPRQSAQPQLEALRAEAVARLQELEGAIARTRNQLRILETLLRRARRQLENGRSAADVARTANAAQARAEISGVMREVQTARHRAQQAQFKLASAEGDTMAEIARAWGVSRQLVSRMVKEASTRRRG